MNNNYITMNFKDISLDEILKQIEQLKQEHSTENIYDIISEDEQITHKIPNDDNDVDNKEEKDNDDVLHNIANDEEENEDNKDSEESAADVKQKELVTVKIYEVDEAQDDDLLTHLLNEDEESEHNEEDDIHDIVDNTDDDSLFDLDLDSDNEEEIDEKEEKQVNEMFAIVNDDTDISASIFKVENLNKLEIYTDEKLSFIRIYHPLISSLEFVHVSDSTYQESTNISADIPSLTFFSKYIGLSSRHQLYIELEPNKTIDSLVVDLNSKQVIINPQKNEFLGELTELPFAKVIDLFASIKQ